MVIAEADQRNADAGGHEADHGVTWLTSPGDARGVKPACAQKPGRPDGNRPPGRRRNITNGSSRERLPALATEGGLNGVRQRPIKG